MVRAPLIVVAGAVAMLLAGQAGGQPQGQPAAVEASVRAVRQATVSQRDGSHLSMLLSLRQLADPSLQPLLAKLVHHREWQVQVHAVLGLAEISDEQHIDPWLVKQIDPRGQEAVIAAALDAKLLKPAQARQLLAWENLEPMARLLLMAEQLTDEPAAIDREALQSLAEHPDLQVAAFASCVAGQIGEKAAFSGLLQRLSLQEQRQRDQLLQYTFEVIRRYELPQGAAWIEEVLNSDGDLSEETAHRGVFAVLACDAKAGLVLWDAYANRTDRYAWRLRYGMILLASYRNVPAAAFDRVAGEEDVLGAIRRAGKALSGGGEDRAAALIALLDLNNAMANEWAMTALDEMDKTVSAPVYAHLVRRLDAREGEFEADRVQLAVRAASALYEIDAQKVGGLLAEAEDDGVMQQALLLGLFETSDPAVGEAAGKVKRIGAGRADSLALMLMARSPGPLAAPDLEQLGRIASGGGRLSDVLRVQAAWLYLRRTGQIDRAIDDIFK